MSKKPMAVYTIRPAKPGGKEFWLEIGTMFPHEKGEGFNILLNASPFDPKLVVMPRKELPADDAPPLAAAK
jgi:hypothetical protein